MPWGTFVLNNFIQSRRKFFIASLLWNAKFWFLVLYDRSLLMVALYSHQ